MESAFAHLRKYKRKQKRSMWFRALLGPALTKWGCRHFEQSVELSALLGLLWPARPFKKEQTKEEKREKERETESEKETTHEHRETSR